MNSKSLGSDKKSGQEVAKQKNASSFSKLDARYWRQKLFRNSFTKTKGGQRFETADWCVRIARKGTRETFNLETAVSDDAARKACQIYLSILSKGWEETILVFKPGQAKPPSQDQEQSAEPVTIGKLIKTAIELSPARIESKFVYAKALRKIVADIFRVPKGNKYDALKGGREAWLKSVDGILLSELTHESVTEWKTNFLAAARNPIERNRAAVTVNSLLRNAKALFSRKIRESLAKKIALPTHFPFDRVPMEKEPSLRYRSQIDAGKLLKSAKTSLAPEDQEAYKLLLLTLVFGLRLSEADWLLWDKFDFAKSTVLIEDTEYMALKSKDSGGLIGIDPEVCSIFQQFKGTSKSSFVLEATGRPKGVRPSEQQVRGYRCASTHKALLSWLRAQGVRGLRPIHTMRKEIGSIIASRDGIWKASRYLRHADIRITNKLYADPKAPIMAGLGVNLI